MRKGSKFPYNKADLVDHLQYIIVVDNNMTYHVHNILD